MLQGKAAVVTGSTSGIGLAIATALAEAGADVMLNGLGSPAEIEAAMATIAATGRKAAYSPANMLKPDEIAGMIAATEKELGHVDILVNNAGIQHVSPIETFRSRSGTRSSPSICRRPSTPFAPRCPA